MYNGRAPSGIDTHIHDIVQYMYVYVICTYTYTYVHDVYVYVICTFFHLIIIL